MHLDLVRRIHMTINQVHRFVYFVPEVEEYRQLGLDDRAGYFGSRTAPLGPVDSKVIVATFYNFHPEAVTSAMSGAWEIATPEQLQQARFRVVRRALDRVGVELSADEIAEARAIIDPVVAALDLGGKTLAAANAALALPDDPLLALWQQVTVLREWRGDVHIALLVANGIGPCECMVLQVGTGRFPMAVVRATRQWSEQEWAEAVAGLAEWGWVDQSGALTETGHTERERIELETDKLCQPIWSPVDEAQVARLEAIIAPINTAMEDAGTYAALTK